MLLLHPILGAASILLMLWIATLGFRGRHRKPYAADARRVHARLARLALAMVLLSAVAGTTSVALIRDDLDLAGSWHFRVGWGLALLMLVQAWLSSRFPARPGLRPVHAGLGVLTAAVGAALAALGMQMLP